MSQSHGDYLVAGRNSRKQLILKASQTKTNQTLSKTTIKTGLKKVMFGCKVTLQRKQGTSFISALKIRRIKSSIHLTIKKFSFECQTIPLKDRNTTQHSIFGMDIVLLLKTLGSD
jgi:ribosomal protein L5